ncbi:MAG: gliding motility-associated C-terminal domain-containing protein [Saprospiraceae bacterium]|nr:gliding motility-associated C-terminal domain-containing protein [Saprospiraceae bacterium]
MYIKQPTQNIHYKIWTLFILFVSMVSAPKAFANCGFSIESIIQSEASCGQSDGSVELVMVGGLAPYNYTWSTGATTANISGLSAGVYTVTITDATSTCTLTDTIILQSVTGPTISGLGSTAAVCQNADGSIDFSIGGTAPFSVAWAGVSSGSQANIASGAFSIPTLTSGNYQVTVTDDNSCAFVFTEEVSQSGGITMNLSVTQNATCAGGTDGIIQAQATAGGLPFEFFLDGISQGSFFSNSFDFTGLGEGTYEVTVADGSGCSVTQSITLIEAGAVPLNASDFLISNASCPSAADGAISSVSCPTCEVYDNQGNLIGNLITAQTALTAGDYEVILNTAGCISSFPFTITDPGTWVISNSIDNPTCIAGQAIIDLDVSGGATSTYNFAWSNGETTEDLVNILPDDYTVTITDGGGCVYTPPTFTVNPCPADTILLVNADSTINFCIDTNDVAGNVVSVLSICPGLVDNGLISPIGADGCGIYTAGSIEGLDTLCLEICGSAGGQCDTTTVIIQIEAVTDTFSTTVFTNTTGTLCGDTSNLPGLVISTTNLNCSSLQNGTLGAINQNTACVDYNAGAQMGSDTICVEVCDDLGFCTQSVLIFNIQSPHDTVPVPMYVGTSTTVCPNLAAFPGTVQNVNNLGCAPIINGTFNGINFANGCVTYTAGAIAGNDTICVEVCDDLGYCDTTTFTFLAVPIPDTAVINLAAGSAAIDTCPINLQYPGTLTTITNLNCDVNNVGTIVVNNTTGCVNYTPPGSSPGSGVQADTVCIEICDASSPVPYCDTMVYIFNNTEPDCSGGLDTLIQTQISDCADTRICLPIPLDSVSLYTYEVNNNAYSPPTVGCDIIRRMQYPISLVPPCSGDFTITWQVNGVTNGPVTVTGFAGIVQQLNLWDGNTAWSLASNPDRIIGVTSDDQIVYGDLTIECAGGATISIGTVEQPQYAQGAIFDFGSTGNHLLIVTDQFNCIDSVDIEIFCAEPDTITDTITLGSSNTICNLDTSQVPNVATIFNACPNNLNTSTFIIDPVTLCVTYTGDSLGSDLACIVICSSNGICDTTYLFVEVTLPVPIAVDDSMTVLFGGTSDTLDVCLNDTFNILDYNLTLLTQPSFGQATVTVNDCEFIYTISGNDCGLDSFTYELSNSAGSSTATVLVEVQCKPFSISEGISPNGDGLNDFFVVNSLVDYPNHEIFIFNRWGTRVFQATNYQNDWQGTFNTSNRLLPDGTYFYLIQLNDENNQVYTGPLIIRR